MTNCTTDQLTFPQAKRRNIQANFDGGSITSDGGVLLLREVDCSLKLTEQVAKEFKDERDPAYIEHTIETMVKQRVYGIALGYEDLNDHDSLRKDIAIQTSVDQDKNLASSPTLCRLENTADRAIAVAIHKIMIEQFIASFKKAPTELILDFDSTDDIVHGNQVGKYYHGYYKNHCFLPLYVFCGKQLLVSYLRTSDKDAATHSWAILALLVKRFRQAWPDVKIIFRGDSGFCRHEMFEWADKNKVFYITGIAQNPNLKKALAPLMAESAAAYEQTKTKQRLFTEFQYGAKTWKRKRRIIGKAEHTSEGANPRFVVTNLAGTPQDLYDNMYCARGEMENRIKDQQLYLFSDRTSCHNWWPNQLRLLFSSLAYILMERLREYALQKTDLAQASIETIRLKIFKIGAVITRNTRTIRLMLSSSYPYQALFKAICKRLIAFG
jgi:Transposase DDE domain group 1